MEEYFRVLSILARKLPRDGAMPDACAAAQTKGSPFTGSAVCGLLLSVNVENTCSMCYNDTQSENLALFELPEHEQAYDYRKKRTQSFQIGSFLFLQ